MRLVGSTLSTCSGWHNTDCLAAQTPSKRLRSQRIYTTVNDENHDPEDDQDELDNEVAELPRKRQRTLSVASKAPITPSTPRHRDVFSQPSTPRHTVMSAGKLFKRMTPQTPLSPANVQTVYHSARQLFARGADPGQLVGREIERQQLVSFLDKASSNAPHGCLYVSGPPGTGKSAMITELVRSYAENDDIRTAYINCMSVKTSRDLYTTLLSQLGQNGDMPEAEGMAALQEIFCPNQKSSTVYVVTLDELDHLLNIDIDSLYKLFTWSHMKSSRLLLVGIANALDLTDRFLPRLKAWNLKPDLLSFVPYNAAQIKNIVTTRLQSLLPPGNETYVPFIHPAAIELCSRKVSSQTGDLRKVFEICRRALDLVETETKGKHESAAREEMLQMTPTKRPLGESVNGVSPGSSSKSVSQIMASSLQKLTAENAPRVSIGHLSKVTAAAFNNGTTQRLKALNLQQKAALCSLVAYENRTRAAVKAAGALQTPTKNQKLAPTIKILFDTYCRLCLQDSILHPLSSSEFREVVGSLENLGLVNAVEGKNGTLVTPQTPSKRGRKAKASTGDDRRVASCAGEKEMDLIAEGVGAGILRSILSGEALD